MFIDALLVIVGLVFIGALAKRILTGSFFSNFHSEDVNSGSVPTYEVGKPGNPLQTDSAADDYDWIVDSSGMLSDAPNHRKD